MAIAPDSPTYWSRMEVLTQEGSPFVAMTLGKKEES